jgi:hypothetical protein
MLALIVGTLSVTSEGDFHMKVLIALGCCFIAFNSAFAQVSGDT